MSRRFVIGSVLALAVLVTVIGVLVSGGDSGGGLAVGGAEQEAGANEDPNLTTVTETLPETSTTTERTTDDVTQNPGDRGEAEPSEEEGYAEEDTDGFYDDADSDYDLPDYPVDDGGGNGVTNFRAPDPRKFPAPPPEIIRDPADILPRYEDPKALLTDEMSAAGNGPGIACLSMIGYSLEEMLEYSDVIIVGEVGETVATDYPARFLDQEAEYTEEELAILYADRPNIYDFRLAFHQIEVHQTLKGSPDTPFILGREDISFYSMHCHPELTGGERILLFAYEEPEPDLATDQVSNFYRTFASYMGIFILDDNDRAYQLTEDYGEIIEVETDTDVNSDATDGSYDTPEPPYETVTLPPVLPSDEQFYHQDQDGGYYLDIEDLRDRIIPGFEGLP